MHFVIITQCSSAKNMHPSQFANGHYLTPSLVTLCQQKGDKWDTVIIHCKCIYYLSDLPGWGSLASKWPNNLGCERHLAFIAWGNK